MARICKAGCEPALRPPWHLQVFRGAPCFLAAAQPEFIFAEVRSALKTCQRWPAGSDAATTVSCACSGAGTCMGGPAGQGVLLPVRCLMWAPKHTC